MRYTVYSDNNLILDTQNENFTLFNPKLDLELNKTGSFSFTIYPNHPSYNSLQRLKSIITVYSDDELIFKGRILNDKLGFYNEKQVTCEGELAFLLDSVQRPYDFMSGDLHTTIEELFTFFINNHNSQVDEAHRFTVGNITVTDPNNYIVRSDTTYMNTWESIQQKLIKPCGGYLNMRHVNGVNYIDYLADFLVTGNQVIEFGKNLLDLTKNIRGEDVATAIIPLGAKINDNSEERTKINSVNYRLTTSEPADFHTHFDHYFTYSGGAYSPLTEEVEWQPNMYYEQIDYIYDEEAVEQYGWIFKVIVWDDVIIPSNLKTKAEQYLDESVNALNSVELSAVDLSSIDRSVGTFRIGTYVKVESEPHSMNQFFRIEKLSIDMLRPDNNKLTLNGKNKSFTEEQNKANAEYNQFVNKTEQNFNDVKGLIQNVNENVQSEISQSAEEIRSRVMNDVYAKDEVDGLISSVSTELVQTKDRFEFNFSNIQNDLNSFQNNADAKFFNIQKYIRFVDGNIVLGQEGNDIILKIENDRIAFLQNDVEVAYFSNRKLFIIDGEFIESLKIGSYTFVPRQNGNLSFRAI